MSVVIIVMLIVCILLVMSLVKISSKSDENYEEIFKKYKEKNDVSDE